MFDLDCFGAANGAILGVVDERVSDRASAAGLKVSSRVAIVAIVDGSGATG